MHIGAHLKEVNGDYDTLTQVLLREREANPRALMAHALKHNFGDAKPTEILYELRHSMSMPQDGDLDDAQKALLQTVLHEKISDESIVHNLVSSATAGRILTEEAKLANMLLATKDASVAAQQGMTHTLRPPLSPGSQESLLGYTSPIHNDVNNPSSAVLAGLQSSFTDQKRALQDQTDSLRNELRRLSLDRPATSIGGYVWRNNNNDERGKTRRNFHDSSGNPNWRSTPVSNYDN